MASGNLSYANKQDPLVGDRKEGTVALIGDFDDVPCFEVADAA